MFKDDLKCGRGKLTWKNNEKIFEGEWLDDQPHVNFYYQTIG